MAWGQNALGTRLFVVRASLSPFSTRRLFSREATFSFVGIAFADVISDADKGKSRFARKKSPSGKRALGSFRFDYEYDHEIHHFWRQLLVLSRAEVIKS